ncbi:MAG: transporter associated domain-containing protein [Holosporales bacterium]
MLRTLVDKLFRRNDPNLREAINELIEESADHEPSLSHDERAILKNVLEMRDTTVLDVMVPRAELQAVPADASLSEVLAAIKGRPHTRVLVYKKNLDDVLGYLHTRDLLQFAQKPEDYHAEKIVQKVLFVPQSMRLLDLLLRMRATRIPMAVVVDEYGGVDGLVTPWDINNSLLGELEEEDAPDEEMICEQQSDGSLIVDARIDMEEVEQHLGDFMTEEEREQEFDSIGGLVLYLAGRVPHAKEIIRHSSGIEFEILEANPRRVTRLRLRRAAD